MKARELKQGKEYKIFDYYRFHPRGMRDASKFVFAIFDGRDRTVFEDNAKRYAYCFIDRKGFSYAFFSYELKTNVMEAFECNETQSRL